MPFVPVPNTVLCEFRMTADLQQVENTVYFELADTPAADDMTDLAELLRDWWISEYAPLVWQGVQLREVVVTDLSSASGPQVSVSPAVAAFGGQTGDPLPTNVSLTVSFRTALRGRSFRGRNFVVGLTEVMTTGANTLGPGTLSAWIDAYTALLALGSPLTATWVVVSRFSGVDANGRPIPRAAGVTTPVTSVTIVDNIIDSQRRRLPGRGN